MDLDFGALFFFREDPLLADVVIHEFSRVIGDESGIAERVNEVLPAQIVGIDEPPPMARNVDSKALATSRRCFDHCQWFAPNRAFRLGTLAFTVSTKEVLPGPGHGSFEFGIGHGRNLSGSCLRNFSSARFLNT